MENLGDTDPKSSEERKKEESSGKERKERDSESDDKDREEHNRERRKARERERSRHRSRDRSPSKEAEVGVTSRGILFKIPPSVMPNRKRRSRSRSRSRSPRHDRKRVRSPLGVRRSRSPRERGHSGSRTPVQRIARSPARLCELKDKDQRRSSSVERRMEKVVAENNRRRPPSPSRSRKRSRLSRSRSRSPSPSNNTLNRKRDNRAFNQKLTLTAMGLWTDKMEREWKLVELEEAVYNEEFLGRNEFHEKLAEIRVKHGMDFNSLLKIEKDYQNKESSVKTKTPAAPPVTVTLNEFLTQWKNMTSVPSSSTTQAPTNGTRLLSSSSLAVDPKSVTSSSIACIDLAGFGLVEVLRLLSTMEDQLSFLASQTKEYFKRAEEYELRKHNKSLELMEEKDLVTLLTQIRDRFVSLRRSPLQSEEALRRLQRSLDGINAILETPQCKKHQIVPSQISPPRREEPEIEIIKVVTEPPSSSQRPTNQPQPDSSEPRRKLSQSQKTKISWMLTHYLIGNGYQDLTDAKLRGLVKNVMGPPGRSRAAQGSTPTSSGTRTFAGRRFVSPDNNTPSHNQQRSASTAPTSFARPRNPSAEPWPSPSNTPQISNIVTTRSMGSAFPSLPDFSTVPSGGVVGRGRDREDRTRRDHVGFNFGSGEVSSSDSGRLSSFTRRGENSSNPFRDV